jgi:hypothetical protein
MQHTGIGDSQSSVSQSGLSIYSTIQFIVPYTSDSLLPVSIGLILPTPSMQNQIHELAKTLPPPRKQNTACDACRFVRTFKVVNTCIIHNFIRSRKVKCNRFPGQEKVFILNVLSVYLHTHFLSLLSSLVPGDIILSHFISAIA